MAAHIMRYAAAEKPMPDCNQMDLYSVSVFSGGKTESPVLLSRARPFARMACVGTSKVTGAPEPSHSLQWHHAKVT